MNSSFGGSNSSFGFGVNGRAPNQESNKRGSHDLYHDLAEEREKMIDAAKRAVEAALDSNRRVVNSDIRDVADKWAQRQDYTSTNRQAEEYKPTATETNKKPEFQAAPSVQQSVDAQPTIASARQAVFDVLNSGNAQAGGVQNTAAHISEAHHGPAAAPNPPLQNKFEELIKDANGGAF